MTASTAVPSRHRLAGAAATLAGLLALAALTLFTMTFILNTVAEAVRLHFRRKTKRL